MGRVPEITVITGCAGPYWQSELMACLLHDHCLETTPHSGIAPAVQWISGHPNYCWDT